MEVSALPPPLQPRRPPPTHPQAWGPLREGTFAHVMGACVFAEGRTQHDTGSRKGRSRQEGEEIRQILRGVSS